MLPGRLVRVGAAAVPLAAFWAAVALNEDAGEGLEGTVVLGLFAVAVPALFCTLACWGRIALALTTLALAALSWIAGADITTTSDGQGALSVILIFFFGVPLGCILWLVRLLLRAFRGRPPASA